MTKKHEHFTYHTSICEYVRENPGSTAKQVANALKLQKSHVYDVFNWLHEQEILVRKCANRGGADDAIFTYTLPKAITREQIATRLAEWHRARCKGHETKKFDTTALSQVLGGVRA